MPRAARDDSVMSGNSMNTDDEDAAGPSKGKGKKVADKGGEDQRKIQNRIAQREFRQRKQQYIKDLEARVELASSSRDEQIEQMRKAIVGLIDENQKLRELLSGVSGFIGSGLGGVLPSIGVDLPEFQALISRQRSDHVHELLSQTRAHDGSTSASGSQTAPIAGPSQKRPRPADSASPAEGRPSDTSFQPSMSNGAPPPPAGMHRFELPPVQQLAMPSFAPPQPYYGASFPAPSPLPSIPFSSVRDTPPGLCEVDPCTEAMSRFAAQGESKSDMVKRQQKETEDFKKVAGPVTLMDQAKHDEQVQQMFTLPTDNPKLQAIQLISYHMRNKREQPGYHLPPSLKATVTQQTVPHLYFFDGIIFPSLRDRLILLKESYDLETLLTDLVEAVELHENDVLEPTNWELGEPFLRKYWYVIDADVLAITNRWRKERGDPELSMRSIVPDGEGVTAEGALGSRASAGRSATA